MWQLPICSLSFITRWRRFTSSTALPFSVRFPSSNSTRYFPSCIYYSRVSLLCLCLFASAPLHCCFRFQRFCDSFGSSYRSAFSREILDLESRLTKTIGTANLIILTSRKLELYFGFLVLEIRSPICRSMMIPLSLLVCVHLTAAMFCCCLLIHGGVWKV